MILLTRASRLATCLFSHRYARTITCLSLSLTLVAIGLLWQPSKRAHAYGRLAIHALEGETFSLPEAKVGSAYEFQFQTEGGLAPLKWSASNLPTGLRLEENGKLHGVPAQAQAEAFAITVTVTDSSRPPQQVALPCLVFVKAAQLRIVTTAQKLQIVTSRVTANSSPIRPTAVPSPGNGEDTLTADVTGVTGTTVPIAAAITVPQGQKLVLDGALYAGSKEVKGYATASGALVIKVLHVGGGEWKSPTKPVGRNEEFKVELKQSLEVGDKVQAEPLSGALLASDVVEVKKAPPLPANLQRPNKGATNISGTSFKDAELRILVDNKLVKLLADDGKEVDALKVADKNGAFNFRLAQSLAGKTIAAQVSDGGGNWVTSQAIAINEIPDLYDWGRVRAYFTAGVMFSKQQDSFSQQDLSIGFNLEKNWWQRDPEKIGTDHKLFSHFNTFFETRISSAPVVTATPAPSPAATATPASSNSSNSGCTGLNCFLASRKVALLQVGGYVPMTLPQFKWEFDGHPNIVFLAPLLKAGVQTITSREEGLPGDDVFNFFAAGVRLGHYKLSNRNRAPELISYLDLGYGRWENFELRTGLDDKGKIITDTKITPTFLLRRRPFRLGAEGRLKIPSTPLFVGFDGNFGDGPDDVRFIFGTRFDVGTLFGNLKKLQGLQQ